MNGSPSVRVALNPRADGSMSPEYTKGALNFWKACTIALEYSRGSGYSGLLTRNLSIARITSSLVITTQLNFAKTIPPHLIIEYVITPFNYTKEFIFLPLLSFSISMFLYCIRISLFPYI